MRKGTYLPMCIRDKFKHGILHSKPVGKCDWSVENSETMDVCDKKVKRERDLKMHILANS